MNFALSRIEQRSDLSPADKERLRKGVSDVEFLGSIPGTCLERRRKSDREICPLAIIDRQLPLTKAIDIARAHAKRHGYAEFQLGTRIYFA